MLALRILSLPIALTVFVLLYVVATKAPHAVETGSLLMWPVLLLICAIKFLKMRNK